MTACGHYVYWDPELNHTELVRWRPGEQIQLIYQSSGDVENTWAYGYKCADGTLTVKVDRYNPSDGQFHSQLFALDS